MSTSSSTKTPSELPFEKAFARLEKILADLNAEAKTLDQSLKLYEEANGLIVSCSKRLHGAQTKIEKLIKDRNQQLATDADGQPLSEPL